MGPHQAVVVFPADQAAFRAIVRTTMIVYLDAGRQIMDSL